MSAADARPFLKWVGGKRQLLPQLLAVAPSGFGTYHEPFLGGGALFFALRPRRAVLSDLNERLVRTYLAVRDRVEKVIALLESYQHGSDKSRYYQTRERSVDGRPDEEVAAWMIYLNRNGFNGLYRVNREGRFNVPYGRHESVNYDFDNLRACSRALQGVTILCESALDPEGLKSRATAGDFVYFDPPYVPLTVTASFAEYTPEGFGLEAQGRLALVAERLAARGVYVVLSNSSAPLVRTLYADAFDLHKVSARRGVACKVESRAKVTELIITPKRSTLGAAS